TLDGTRVHILGRASPVVVDPGPADPAHLTSLGEALAEARSVTVLVTHGHADHAGAVTPVVEGLEARGVAVDVRGSGHEKATPLADGEAMRTEVGTLVSVATPGHTRDHLAFHWREARSLFAGDLLMGEGETTWVAGYPGCVADYLASLTRLRALDLRVIYPAHGPALGDASDAIHRFEAHRRERIAQVRAARAELPDASPDELLDAVYGDTVPPDLRSAALESLEALLEFVERHPAS
ncbi:MAG TPA: MBL fold metallo-hydrolase, partial [Longimicrobiales bacterium]|nr:MBL fold metallo-hydrolase [Longimicrobiales bacterium]